MQSVKCLLYKREDLSLVSRIHVKSWAWQHAPVIPVMGNQNLCKELGMAACTYILVMGSQRQEDPRGLLVSKPCIKWQSFFTKFIIKEGRKRGESEKGRFERGREGESWLFQD